MSRLDIVSHPGEILKQEFLEPLDISENALAMAIDVPRSRINAIVQGKRGITIDTALRLGRFFDLNPQGFIDLQAHYDQMITKEKLADTLASIKPFQVNNQHQ